MTIMNDQQVISALISAAIALFIGLLTIWLNFWKIRKEFKQVERRLSEELTVELVKQRIDSYEKLMTDMKRFSSLEIRDADVATLKNKAKEVIIAIQNGIFGRFGLVATHETRETVLRLREKCCQFIEDKILFEEVHKASWEVHQMLRSDIGLSQPNLMSAIDRLRSEKLAGKKEEIEELLSKIHHNKWNS